MASNPLDRFLDPGLRAINLTEEVNPINVKSFWIPFT